MVAFSAENSGLLEKETTLEISKAFKKELFEESLMIALRRIMNAN